MTHWSKLKKWRKGPRSQRMSLPRNMTHRQWLLLRLEGKTCMEIAKQFGVTERAVLYLMARYRWWLDAQFERAVNRLIDRLACAQFEPLKRFEEQKRKQGSGLGSP